MQREYLTDGELGYIGLNSRDNPALLSKGYVSKSVNMRLNRGVATVRKGLKKYSKSEIYGPDKSVVGTGVYLNTDGQEILILIVHNSTDNLTSLYTFNPQSGIISAPKVLPVTITSSEGVDVVHAVDKVFITRGHSNRPVMWDMVNTFTELPLNKEFPNCTNLMFFKNRLVATGHHLSMSDTRKRDTVCVSHFLEYDKWPLADAFTINQGGNDEVVSVVPWTINEFLILCRNSSFYLNVGSTRYTTGSALASDARLESLSVDVGCVAGKTAVQVGPGVFFLSDNGVYNLTTAPAGQSDGLKLLSVSEPLSAPIDDIIQRINKDAVKNAVACYWGNRYYLAVPLDQSVKNNAVLIFNFLLKAWETVDIYDENVDVFRFLVAKLNNQRRLFIVDSNEGILLTDETVYDEKGAALGTPLLNTTPQTGPYAGSTGAYLPFTLTNDGYSGIPVVGELVTRSFTAGDSKDKRFSSIETDFYAQSGSIIETYAVTSNPDTVTKIDTYLSSQEEDLTRRNPVRKIAYGLQVRFLTSNTQPSIRSNFIKFTMNGKNNINSA